MGAERVFENWYMPLPPGSPKRPVVCRASDRLGHLMLLGSWPFSRSNCSLLRDPLPPSPDTLGLECEILHPATSNLVDRISTPTKEALLTERAQLATWAYTITGCWF